MLSALWSRVGWFGKLWVPEGHHVVIAPGIWILSLRFWMYRVSVAGSSGASAVSVAVGGSTAGCCSGCGGAADMMEDVVAKTS